MRTVLAVLIAFGAAAAYAGLQQYDDPWSPATEAAAEAAVARLGAARSIGVKGTVLNIVGLEAKNVIASVDEVKQALSALNAQENAVEIRVNFPADVLFDFDKSDVRPDAAKALSYLATIIRAHPAQQARLEGHTDGVGNDAYNQALSERRAESVKEWLIRNEHLDGSKLVTKGWGRTKPIASNDTAEGRQKNRRLEAVIAK